MEKAIQKAAQVISNAEALIVTAGAGIGVDSGLPDFRGPQGFWRAYPIMRDKGLKLEEMATPHWFDTHSEFAWGFYAHRYKLYRTTQPHLGFNVLQRWGERMSKGYYAFTSNVDGQFQKAGFPENKVVEWHGTIHYMQLCHADTCREIWPVPNDANYEVEDGSLLLKSPLPMGPPGRMDQLARPNIKMFFDNTWVPDRTMAQKAKFDEFHDSLDQDTKLVVFEVGCGESNPKIRKISEDFVANAKHGTLIRVNPRDLGCPAEHILLPLGGLEAITRIDAELKNRETQQ